ncbi:helix-turn-helix transcriptional regulator [Streptacidiphilus sp. PB12-B1b]|uniref:helix-turn-helix domain-containing protein n=1 Tax=Streptacidiphilus sp. PB12-B1b TaxID=2705012 RepID=UPI0015FDC6D4|nr:helix-turn-helix transcriptional regulator [Streptacidiphilus sp. PB12-B1b]QMU79486.1 helix-turn-helix transcriptional regulator [Streptacidiphilus sp. PB12-B1b]
MATANEPPDPTSSVLAFFASEVIRLRTQQGWSQEELARRAHATQAAISYVETAKRVPSDLLAHGLDMAFEAGGLLIRLQPLVVRYAYPTWFLPYVELEREALSMRVFESQIIPGLLQTEEYARALMASGRPDSMDDAVAARMSRQSLLEGEGDERPRAWFVIDEQVLRRQIGGPDVWRAQLIRLLKEAQQPRTVIQVIPEQTTSHPGLQGPFTLLNLADTPEVLFVDGFAQGRLGLDPAEISEATRAYDLLKAMALSPAASGDLITGYLEGNKQ